MLMHELHDISLGFSAYLLAVEAEQHTTTEWT